MVLGAAANRQRLRHGNGRRASTGTHDSIGPLPVAVVTAGRVDVVPGDRRLGDVKVRRRAGVSGAVGVREQLHYRVVVEGGVHQQHGSLQTVSTVLLMAISRNHHLYVGVSISHVSSSRTLQRSRDSARTLALDFVSVCGLTLLCDPMELLQWGGLVRGGGVRRVGLGVTLTPI